MGGDLFERLHVPSPGNTSLAIAKWLRFEHRTRWICCCGIGGISLHLPPVEAESHPPSSRNPIVVRLRLLLPLQPVGVCSRKCRLFTDNRQRGNRSSNPPCCGKPDSMRSNKSNNSPRVATKSEFKSIDFGRRLSQVWDFGKIKNCTSFLYARAKAVFANALSSDIDGNEVRWRIVLRGLSERMAETRQKQSEKQGTIPRE